MDVLHIFVDDVAFCVHLGVQRFVSLRIRREVILLVAKIQIEGLQSFTTVNRRLTWSMIYRS